MSAMPAATEADRIVEQFRAGAAALPGPKRFTDAELGSVHAIAYNLYTQGRFAEAERYFGFLSFYRPLDCRYLVSIGSCRQMQKNFSGAIESYSLATLLEPENPEPSLHVAECLLGLGEAEAARETLHMVANLCRLKGGHADVAARAEALQSLLGQKKH
jgi:type III secretion system low calcium response chaperone LcrH/SycD